LTICGVGLAQLEWRGRRPVAQRPRHSSFRTTARVFLPLRVAPAQAAARRPIFLVLASSNGNLDPSFCSWTIEDEKAMLGGNLVTVIDGEGGQTNISVNAGAPDCMGADGYWVDVVTDKFTITLWPATCAQHHSKSDLDIQDHPQRLPARDTVNSSVTCPPR
jgi:hypothetical protein